MATPIANPFRGTLRVEVNLDWRGPGHYAHGCPLACRICDTPTCQRDDDGQPCHCSCERQRLEDMVMSRAFGTS